MVHSGFKGIRSGGYSYEAVPPPKVSRYAYGWRVRTFATPQSVAAFIGAGIGRGPRMVLQFESGDVEIIDSDGRLNASKSALAAVALLLSNEEANILRLFGVNLPALAAEDDS